MTRLEQRRGVLLGRVDEDAHLSRQVVGPLKIPRHTWHVYDGLPAVDEYECGADVPPCGSSWSLAREFVWGGRFPEPIAMVDHTSAGLLPANQPEVLHYLHDVLGSVIGLTNSAGTLVERYTYDPYGKTLVERRDPLTGSFEMNGADGNFPTWSAYGNPFMWTGQRYDATVGLYHFKYRTYNPIWGRWNQQDPLGYVDGANLYEYIRSNPLSWVDPLGLLAQATQPTSGPSSQPASGPTTQPDGKKKCSKYSDDVFGETGGLRPQFKDPKDPKKEYDPKSEEELHKARKAVAEVAKNREEANKKPPLHEKTPTDEELKNPHTKREWEKSKKAAEEAEKEPSLPKDARHFYIRKGDKQGDDGKLVDRPGWAGGSDPYQSFGPFRNVGGGDVKKGDDIYIDIYKGVK